MVRTVFSISSYFTTSQQLEISPPPPSITTNRILLWPKDPNASYIEILSWTSREAKIVSQSEDQKPTILSIPLNKVPRPNFCFSTFFSPRLVMLVLLLTDGAMLGTTRSPSLDCARWKIWWKLFTASNEIKADCGRLWQATNPKKNGNEKSDKKTEQQVN